MIQRQNIETDESQTSEIANDKKTKDSNRRVADEGDGKWSKEKYSNLRVADEGDGK